MNPSQTLYRIQRVDLKLAAQRKRAREIDAELASDEAVQQAEQAQREIEQALRPQEARATNLNLELQTIAAQRSQFSAQLYGGAVSNPKELQDIEHSSRGLARRHSELRRAARDDDASGLSSAVKEASAHWPMFSRRALRKHGPVEERQQIRAEIDAKAREKLVTVVSADALALYEDLWPRKQGHAVAVMDGDRCERCGVSQTEVMAQRVRQGQEIVFCSNCGRILITR